MPVPPADIVCQLVAGDLSAAVVTRTEELVAFLDHRPVFKGHVLVSPVEHVDTMLELPALLMAPLLTLAQRVARAQAEVLGAHGTFVAINNVVSQSVPHLHLHVVPRRRKDGLRGFFWPRTSYADGEADQLAADLAAALPRSP
ncbi:HIT family protein [Desertihabitans brevis]|uniref:HIT family protein n=1 Tax=Desertihabitans brevis TaxID=2268447 RepID=A0A367YZL1_9ACTN|nr:HIT family protein [Desertihabitans brevis]RCK71345.1 HIT family protein [Desertihabitans brevis]